MNKGIYVAVSGSIAQERAMDVISNNLSNVNTRGYKADRVLFEAYLQKNLTSGANPVPAGKSADDAAYAITSQVYTDFSQGPLKATEAPLDIALHGEGFFTVQAGEGERYWRGGTLNINQKGELVTPAGARLLDVDKKPIIAGFAQFRISNDGTVISEKNQPIAKIRIVDFKNKSVLTKKGDGLFTASNPDTAIASTALVKQGFVEGSNINPVAEMAKMITTLRSYQAFQKAIQSHDEMTGRLLGNVAR